MLDRRIASQVWAAPLIPMPDGKACEDTVNLLGIYKNSESHSLGRVFK
jgi:hypothetical protein